MDAKTKRWWQSSTIRWAIASYVVPVASLGHACLTEGRWPNEAERAAIMGGAIALNGTIRGRVKASREIGKPDISQTPTPEPLNTQPALAPQFAATPTNSRVDEPDDTRPVAEPDFEYIAKLGSAESAVPSLLEVGPEDDLDDIDSDEEDLDIDLESLAGKCRLVAKQDTYLKTSIRQSDELSDNEKQAIQAGQEIEVDSWRFPDTKNRHIEVTIDEYAHLNGGKFFVWSEHFELINVQGQPVEIEVPTADYPLIKTNLTPFKLPGFTSTFYLENPIYEGSHFTWAEATKNGSRIPETKAIVENIIAQARKLDQLRAHLGNRPMVVTSWYRDPKTNARVGGATRSSHLTGSATDIYCPDLSIWKLQSRVLDYWRHGGLGKGAPRGFVHVASDGRYRVWNY